MDVRGGALAVTHRAEPTVQVPSLTAAAAAAILLAVSVWWPPEMPPRVVSDAAAVCALGLAVVGFLDCSGDLAHRATGALQLAGLCWLLSETARMVVMASQAAGSTVIGVSPEALWLYAVHTAPGRANLVAVAAAALLCLGVLMGASRAVATGLAAAGLATRALTGHLALAPLGSALVAVHAVAAGLWCGTLVALVLTVRHRAVWARVLPAYSRLALPCVVALLGTGLLGALLVLDSPSMLYGTGYGRLLLVKAALTVVLMVVGWRQRRGWLPAARAQSIGVAASGRRAVAELALMAAVLIAAAVLSLTAAA